MEFKDDGKPKEMTWRGNPNQMESGGQISGGTQRTANLGPWRISNTCITCGIVAIIVLAILILTSVALILTTWDRRWTDNKLPYKIHSSVLSSDIAIIESTISRFNSEMSGCFSIV